MASVALVVNTTVSKCTGSGDSIHQYVSQISLDAFMLNFVMVSKVLVTNPYCYT